MVENRTPDLNVGHGHIFKRPDGVKVRCGGPSLCSECARDYARYAREKDAKENAQPSSNPKLRRFKNSIRMGSNGPVDYLREHPDGELVYYEDVQPEIERLTAELGDANALISSLRPYQGEVDRITAEHRETALQADAVRAERDRLRAALAVIANNPDCASASCGYGAREALAGAPDETDGVTAAAREYEREELAKLRDFVMSATWFDPVTMAGRSAVRVVIERLSENGDGGI